MLLPLMVVEIFMLEVPSQPLVVQAQTELPNGTGRLGPRWEVGQIMLSMLSA
jgi:hypothetical protein